MNYKATGAEKEKNEKKVVNDKDKFTETKVKSVNMPPHLPQRLRKNQEEACYKRFFNVLK